MTRKLDYRWNLRQVMAAREMFQTTDLIEPLAQRGIHLSSSQVYRLVVERPERLSLKVLMALMDILDCAMDELIEPVAAPTAARKSAPQPARKPVSAGCVRSALGSAGSTAEPCPTGWRRRCLLTRSALWSISSRVSRRQ
jgi:DNA-binding Xre family transcriptional regulator